MTTVYSLKHTETWRHSTCSKREIDPEPSKEDDIVNVVIETAALPLLY
jgi:hypothetical protein